jgi:hypothetical protein
MFDHTCNFRIPNTNIDIEEMELEFIDFGAEEIFADEDGILIYAPFESFGAIQKELESRGIEILSSGFERIPQITKKLTDAEIADVEKLIEKIEDNPIWQNDLNRARANMNKIQRPRRNIQRVNYAGMDMTSEDIGELCVFKPWFENGKVIEKCSRRRLSQANELDDEDYVFEEDQDDKEEEEQDAKEKFCKKIWAKIHPESTAMPRRTRKQINYAGMDMNEDDIGEVSICKPWFKDGKVTYKWSKRNLSQVNELDDEDEAVIYKYGKKIYI